MVAHSCDLRWDTAFKLPFYFSTNLKRACPQSTTYATGLTNIISIKLLKKILEVLRFDIKPWRADRRKYTGKFR